MDIFDHFATLFIMKMSIEIPLLIREKLDYYLYYVPVRRQMHLVIEEYLQCIISASDRSLIIQYTSQYIRYNRRILTSLGTGGKIHMAKYDLEEYYLPGRYFYSSGLNNPNGYF